MITSIHQPSFFPWLGLLDKIAKSEQYIFLDDVHANKAAFQYRNIFYCNGEAKYIGLPVDYSVDKKISELNFKNDDWREDNLNKMRNYYLKAPYFDAIYPYVSSLYSLQYEKPVDLIIRTMLLSFELFHIKVRTFRSSELSHTGSKGDLVLDLCLKTNTTTYLSGKGAMHYMTPDVVSNFAQNKIDIEYQQFDHPSYLQNEHFAFVSGLSFLDILFFQGVDKGNEIFWNNVKGISNE